MKSSRKRADEAGDLATGSTAPRADAPLSIAAAIGVQIRQLRKRQDITAAELAHQAGLSAGMLSKIENGTVSASLESLESLARALNVPLTSFFATYEERRDCSYVPAGKGVTIERRGTKAGHQYQLLGHSIAGNLVVEPYLITLSDEAEPYPVFQHAGIEFIFMLTGRGHLPPRRQDLSSAARRRPDVRQLRPARPRRADQAAHDLPLHHRLHAGLDGDTMYFLSGNIISP